MPDEETPSSLLTLPQIGTLMATSFQDYLVMQATGLNIANQPMVQLDLVPTLPQTQALARSHVQDYQDDKSSKHIYIFEQVQAYNNMLQRFAQTLLPYAQGWDGGDKNSAEQVKHGLTQMCRYPITNKEATEQIQNDLKSYHQSITDDRVRYQTDEDSADEKVGGASGEIATLRQHLKELGSSLDEANRRIAEGASRNVVKALETGLKAGMAMVEVPGLADLVVDTAFTYVDDAVGDEGDPLADSDSLVGQYRAALERLADEQAQMGVLATLRLNVERFSRSLDSVIATLDQLGKAWNDLAEQIDTLSSYNSAEGPSFFTDQVTQAQQFWQSMSDKAAQYETAITKIDWGATDVR